MVVLIASALTVVCLATVLAACTPRLFRGLIRDIPPGHPHQVTLRIDRRGLSLTRVVGHSEEADPGQAARRVELSSPEKR